MLRNNMSQESLICLRGKGRSHDWSAVTYLAYRQIPNSVRSGKQTIGLCVVFLDFTGSNSLIGCTESVYIFLSPEAGS